MNHGAMFTGVRRRHDRNGILQLETHESFRTQIHTLSLGDGVRSGSGACARDRSDGRAFAAAEDATENSADRSTAGGLFNRVLAAGCCLAFPGIRRDLIALAVEADLLQS